MGNVRPQMKTVQLSEEKLKVAATLRKYRVENGLSQQKVADMLGIDRSTYSYYETGKVCPSFFQMMTLFRLYQVTAETFMANENCDYYFWRTKRPRKRAQQTP